MRKYVKYTPEILGWQRKPGPPRVWRVIDGRRKTADGKNLKFSIQEIPEDRYEDVLDQMCSIYLRDEPMCRYLGLIIRSEQYRPYASTAGFRLEILNEMATSFGPHALYPLARISKYNFIVVKNGIPGMIDSTEAITDFRNLWSFALQQGVVVGAFLVDENNRKPVLAGVNMSLIYSEATEKGLETIEITSERTLRMFRYIEKVEEEKKTRQVYNVDKYIVAFGLNVDPRYRGQGLAFQLLKARDDIGMAYDIRATSSIFTASAAVKAATEAGFETLVVQNFQDIRNDDGTESFPGIPLKSCAYMGKRFSWQK